jgi:hypothetical protein
MTLFSVVIGLFILLEGSNIFLLYFFPKSQMGNAVGMFNAYEKSKADPEIHALVKYLINWVAGSKLIFVTLLLVLIFTGDETIQLYSMFALIVSISTFFWRLYPLMKSMDQKGQITPKGYSKTLAIMISCFILTFVVALIYYFFFSN